MSNKNYASKNVIYSRYITWKTEFAFNTSRDLCGAIATEGVDRACAVEKCVASSFCLVGERNQLFWPPSHDKWEQFLQSVHAA
jgi:hypothetical protein